MPYTAQTWVDGNTSYPLSAARMSNIENGLVAAAAIADIGHRAMTTATRDGLSSVTAGTMIYNTTVGALQVYNGTTWRTVIERTIPPMCQMIVTAAQSIGTSATDATLTSSSFALDTDSMGGTANRITITTAGVYQVSYSIQFAANATGYRAATIAKNGTGSAVSGTGTGATAMFGSTSSGTSLTATVLMNLAAADYLTLVAAQSSGGALALSSVSMFLQASFVGRAS